VETKYFLLNKLREEDKEVLKTMKVIRVLVEGEESQPIFKYSQRILQYAGFKVASTEEEETHDALLYIEVKGIAHDRWESGPGYGVHLYTGVTIEGNLSLKVKEKVLFQSSPKLFYECRPRP